MRHWRLVGDPWKRRIVDRVPGDPLVELPHIVLFGIARERRSQGDHGLHFPWMIARELAAEEAAEAPADDDDRPVVPEPADPLLELVERIRLRPQVPALLPSVDPKARPGELA